LGNLYWIEGPWRGRLAIVERPRGGDETAEDIAALRQAGIDVLVSMLSAEEAAALGLAEEAQLCEDEGIAFLAMSVTNLVVPRSGNELRRLAESLGERLRAGESVGVHCRFSIGRSGLLASALLIDGRIEPEAAFERVSLARGAAVPRARSR
jgi:protein-tyrosine phosphatase